MAPAAAEEEFALLRHDGATEHDLDAGEELGIDESNQHGVSSTHAAHAAEEQRLRSKIDARIMPVLFVMIVLNYLDRTSLSLARLQHLEADLSMRGADFSTAVAAFFVGYVALQVPSNMLVARVRPSLYLPGCMVVWGVLSAGTGLVSSKAGLVATRVGVGVCEAPFFPGALFLLSSWYTREELALRTAILYSGSLLAGAFGGLIAAGIESGLDGVWGLSSWRWLFLLEGSCTVAVAAMAMCILPDYPRTTRSLSVAERAIAVRRMTQQTKAHSHAEQRRDGMVAGLVPAVQDYKVWLLAAIILTKTSAAAITSFIPTLLASSSSSSPSRSAHTTTLLLVAPPYLLAALATLLVSRHSDRACERARHVIVPMLVAATAFGALALVDGQGGGIGWVLRYAALATGLAGVYASYNVALAWIGSTIPAPASKRSTAIAIINVCGNIAQIYSPYLYLPRYAPDYRLAMIANAGFCLACVGVTVVLRMCLSRENGRLDRVDDESGGQMADKPVRYVL